VLALDAQTSPVRCNSRLDQLSELDEATMSDSENEHS
jgi:hypothetical protein